MSCKRVIEALREIDESRQCRRRTIRGLMLCSLGWHDYELLDSGWVERCRDCSELRIAVPADVR